MLHPTPIDITTIPGLARIVEEVEATKTPRELKRENKTVAVIMPSRKAPAKQKREKTKADYEAFKSAAGSWKDVDTDTLIKNIYEQRRRSNKPPIEV